MILPAPAMWYAVKPVVVEQLTATECSRRIFTVSSSTSELPRSNSERGLMGRWRANYSIGSTRSQVVLP